MPNRFIFRMVYYEDCALFFQDGEIRAKNSKQSQSCHQTSYSQIVSRRGDGGLCVPSGEVINDHVAFYFSPITAMSFTIYQGNVPFTTPAGIHKGNATMDNRVFFVANVENFRDIDLTYWFSDIACNSRAPMPQFSNDLEALETHVAWDLFDDGATVAAISEIGYAGVTKWFHNKDTPERYQNRKQKRMAEFLVKGAVPLTMFDCIVAKDDLIKGEVRRMMQNTGVDLKVYSKPGCYH